MATDTYTSMIYLLICACMYLRLILTFINVRRAPVGYVTVPVRVEKPTFLFVGEHSDGLAPGGTLRKNGVVRSQTDASLPERPKR